MKRTRDFEAMGDRYKYDFNQCTTGKGWAQVDTSSDASYYGMWANPEKLKIFEFCEGDLTLTSADTLEEFITELKSIASAERFIGIDPGFNSELSDRFHSIGLGHLLH